MVDVVGIIIRRRRRKRLIKRSLRIKKIQLKLLKKTKLI
jgi:hypothetical protein